ncbi:MAG: dephospho-CoA kinase [Bacteroidales bacterium]|nr:MAG: dephospho-CoA kinase [Bacteroidales bacterium]
MINLGVTGGIGSGKSMVCSIISAMGYPVYNADLEARQLVDSDPDLILSIKELFGEDIYTKNQLDRKRVAEVVFSNQNMLEGLNAIVHPAVTKHYKTWVDSHKTRGLIVKEAAILFESGANIGLEKIVVVTAPLEVRIQRVVKRDGLSEESAMKRMNNQLPQDELVKRGDYIIENDGVKLILPQVVRVINNLVKDF